MKHNTAIKSLAALSLAATVGLIAAGPLSPPAGSVSSNYKTLSEVEPRVAINATNTPGDADSVYRITSPGSYYLTANVLGALGKSGIEIASDNVTIDLCGFTLQGVAGSLSGVATPAAHNNLTIRNGVVRGWGARGVAMYDISSGEGSLAEDLLISDNGAQGLMCNDRSIIRRCTVRNHPHFGIVALSNTLVEACVVTHNTNSGISVSSGSVVRGCSAQDNSGYGILVQAGCQVSECSARANTTTGIYCSSVSAGGTTITRCVASKNGLDGIFVPTDCVVLANECDGNGDGAGDGAGVHAGGFGNRIESNHCSDADRGIRVDSSGNLVIRNSCSGNTLNWSIFANNACGPVLDRTSPASAPISGNTGASSLLTTDPNANFTY